MIPKIAALLTDFGTADYFVGCLKGALLAVAPDATIVDVTHDIPAHDIHAAAWTLANTYTCFPANTAHVCVVDPGVGSARRALAVRARDQFFVGPDNGLFTFVYEQERDVEVVELTNEDFFRRPVSRTFHGRDIFAPVAAALLNGADFHSLGRRTDDYISLPLSPVRTNADGSLEAQVIHIDRFGNLITNLRRDEIERAGIASATLTIELHGRRFGVRETFAAGDDGDLFAVWGSAGCLEIVARGRSAATLSGADRGASVFIHRRD